MQGKRLFYGLCSVVVAIYVVQYVLLSIFYTTEETKGLVSWLNFDFVFSFGVGGCSVSCETNLLKLATAHFLGFQQEMTTCIL